MPQETSTPQVEAVNENSIMIRFGQAIDKKWPAIIASARHFLLQKFALIITDTIPSYTTLMVCFDDDHVSAPQFVQQINEALVSWAQSPHLENRIPAHNHLIPVFYDTNVAPDLEPLSRQLQLSIAEIIQIHTQATYVVYAIGFAPGFAFLGNVDPRIEAPRLSTPRANVAKGSVGIAGAQTGIYPRSSPGGWNIIGCTPQDIFFPDQPPDKLCLLAIGDTIKFKAISQDHFIDLGGSVNRDE